MSKKVGCPKGTMRINGKCFIPKNIIRKHWVDGKTFSYKNKKYRVGKMSYGDYFLEPITKKVYGEREGFAPNTLWLQQISGKKMSEFLQVGE